MAAVGQEQGGNYGAARRGAAAARRAEGDRLEFWAEGRFIELPESGAQILFATERHNYMTGCQEDDCHGSIRRHPIRVATLDPDYPVTLTYADFAAGRDPAMEKVMALIGGE